MEIKQIKSMPTVIGNTHESVLRAYQILEKVKQMLERGDSKETIIETIKYLEQNETEKYVVTGNPTVTFNRNCNGGNKFL
jgi:capsular polysaccharide biosynthesis protein